MPAEAVHECRRGACRRGEAHVYREYHHQVNLLLSRLNEQQRHWYLAVESERLGFGADRILYEITSVDKKTIRRGRVELAGSLADRPVDRVRLPSGGWPPTKKGADLLAAVQQLVEQETAGNPMTGRRSSSRSVSDRLAVIATR
jgi:hypothetical protein